MLTSALATETCLGQVTRTIDILSDDALLEVFHHFQRGRASIHVDVDTFIARMQKMATNHLYITPAPPSVVVL